MAKKSGMRWFTIPKTQKLIKQVMNAMTGEVVKELDPEDWDYFQFLEDNVWPHQFWRESKENAEAQERLQDIFDDARREKKNSIGKAILVKMAEDDYQKLVPIATMRDQRIGGINARAIMRHAQSIMFATSKDPTPKEETEEEDREEGAEEAAGGVDATGT